MEQEKLVIVDDDIQALLDTGVSFESLQESGRVALFERPDYITAKLVHRVQKDYLSLQEVWDSILKCKGCPLGKSLSGKKVIYRGDTKSKVFVLGEAPGRKEAEIGTAFVGPAGVEFDKMVTLTLGINPNHFYISNTVRCRPPKNRKPTVIEQQTCQKYWQAEIRILEPKLIIALGSYATKALGLSKSPIMKELAGNLYSYQDIPVLVLYHPAATLYAQGERIREHIVKSLQKHKKLILESLG